ncbi:putative membrane protein YecN with MAPEG domain [Microbacteriaceae bacterium SG_E_30_P1]|uniref:Membrane protein YecN with MAPEG domain n=1 Tax=Antiquaquibacter oligotrophicus TaxID=2880260 RepID=A0ABT6KMP6_9MICO|nr:hypothetical protein [Antiquaquibacter oligotrophicus]MDH6181274.1 putative membrane protein YecN with MAPEG domain [Antiquaquibacter oligotrophicus]UDF13031.1 hypothetical protein LH407_12845 [Antiquaquibacter oligotrophicus]
MTRDEVALREHLEAAATPEERARILGIDLAALTRAARGLNALSIAVIIAVPIAVITLGFMYIGDADRVTLYLATGLLFGVGGVILAWLCSVFTASRSLVVAVLGSVLANTAQLLMFAAGAWLGDSTRPTLVGLLVAGAYAAALQLRVPGAIRRVLNAQNPKPETLLAIDSSSAKSISGVVGPTLLAACFTLLALGAEAVLVVFAPNLILVAVALSAVFAVLTALWRERRVRTYALWAAYVAIILVAIWLAT